MSKKIIIIISVVLGILLIALVGYYFIVQNNTPGTGSGLSVFKNFFPFGGNEVPAPSGDDPNNENVPQNQPEQSNFTKKLRRLSSVPVSGAGVLDVKAGTVVRYIEKATGHIYEVELFSPKQGRISNTTIPLVYDALWGNKNNSLIARYLKDDDRIVDTYSLTIKEVSTTTENTVSGIVFPENISDVSVFDTNVFYLEQGNSSSNGYISNFSGGNKKLIWNSPTKELLSQFVNAKTVALTTKPHQSFPGFLYFVDTGTGQVKKILGDILGLSTLTNPLATQVLYLDQGTNQMSVFDIKSKVITNLVPATFPEKCAWSKKDALIIYCAVPKGSTGSNSLTDWYMGFISFSDDVWKFDTKNNISVIVDDLTLDSGTIIDVTKPILSDNGQYLVFINRIDNTLWSLDLLK